MTPSRLLRAAGIVALTTTALPLGPESESAAEPRPSAPTTRADPARAASPHSEVLLQRPGGPEQDPAAGFVVLTRPDGRVPRAWLWDEPLGCPATRP